MAILEKINGNNSAEIISMLEGLNVSESRTFGFEKVGELRNFARVLTCRLTSGTYTDNVRHYRQYNYAISESELKAEVGRVK